MNRPYSLVLLLSLLIGWATAVQAKPVVVLKIDGPIGPATSEYFRQGMAEAKARDAAAVVLQMDTPGGLDGSMREIIREILGSSVPVISFVAPRGSRAASAGTYILYASHVAAMAPGTNLGAATPVRVGGGGGDDEPAPRDADTPNGKPSGDAMERKIVNDAAAYIRSLAQLRGRNGEWAEKAVREAVSLSAQEAAQMKVVDLIADDLTSLLAKVDGREVKVGQATVTLRTANAEIQHIEPDWRNKLLSVITNPNVAYILMLVGIYGLFFELMNPGSVVPGVLGGISILLALFAFQALPINYAGLGLLLLGLAFIVAEAFVPSFGMLGIGGVAAFVIGSVMLLDRKSEYFDISLGLIVGFGLVSAAVMLGIAYLAVRSHGRPIVSGGEQMIGAEGEVLRDFTGKGQIRVHGEIWSAVADEPLLRGDKVRVLARDGLRLRVARV